MPQKSVMFYPGFLMTSEEQTYTIFCFVDKETPH